MHSFKKILRTSLLFLLIIAVISVALMEAYFRSERDYFQDGSERAALAGTLDTVFLGASHAYRAFDPTVIDPILGTHSYNLSGALMSMRSRLLLLQEEVSRNPVKTVVLEVSFNTMSRVRRNEGIEGDLYTMSRLDRFSDRVSFFFGFYFDEWPDVYYKFVSEGVNVLASRIKGQFVQKKGDRRFGFVPTGPGNYKFTDNYQSIYRTRWKWINESVDEENLSCLDQITALCKEKNIELILVTTPISKEQLCSYGDYDVPYRWYCQYAEAQGLRYVDFNLYKEKETLFPDSEMFFDTLHLNTEGAERFSRLFAELEQRMRSGEDLSDQFYDSYAGLAETWGLQ